MSFGISIGDLIALGNLAKQLHRDVYMAARSAPDELRQLTRELGCLSEALGLLVDEARDPDSLLNRAGEGRALTVREVCEGTRETLTRLEGLAKKHGLVALAREEKEKDRKSSRSLARRGWDRVKFARDYGEVERLRGKLVYHYSVMQLLLTSVGNSSLERLESENRAMASSVQEIKALLRRGSVGGGAGQQQQQQQQQVNVDGDVNVNVNMNVTARTNRDVQKQTPPPELPVISALEGDVADHLSQLFMEKAEARGSWLSVGLDAWIQNGKWWLMKSQTALGSDLSAAGPVDPQTYTDLLKASWILLDVVSEHPQRTFLAGGTQQFTIRTLAEGIKAELRTISDAGCPVPAITEIVTSDLTIWSSQTATSLELKRQLTPSPNATAYGWSIANGTLIYQKFGHFVSLIGDKVECVILLLVDSGPQKVALRKGHDHKGPSVKLVGQNAAGVDLVNIDVQAVCVLELESKDGEYCLYECESEESSEDDESSSGSDDSDNSEDESVKWNKAQKSPGSGKAKEIKKQDANGEDSQDDGWQDTESSSDEKGSTKRAPKQGIKRRRTGQDPSSTNVQMPLRRASTFGERERDGGNTTKRFGKNRGDADEDSDSSKDSDEDDVASIPSTVASSKASEDPDEGLQERREELENPIRAIRIEFPKSSDALELYAMFFGLRIRAEWFETEEEDVRIIASVCVLTAIASPTSLPYGFIVDQFHRVVGATEITKTDKEIAHASTYSPKPIDMINLTFQTLEKHRELTEKSKEPTPLQKDASRATWSSSARTIETVYRILALTAQASPTTFAPILRSAGFHPLVTLGGGELDVFEFITRTRKTHALKSAKSIKEGKAAKNPDSSVPAMEMLMQELVYTIVEAEFEFHKDEKDENDENGKLKGMINLTPEKDDLTWDMLKFGDELLRNLKAGKKGLKGFTSFIDILLTKKEIKDRLVSLNGWTHRVSTKGGDETSTAEKTQPWDSSPTVVAFLTERSLVGAMKLWRAFLQEEARKRPDTFCKRCGRYRCDVHDEDDDSSDSDESDAGTRKKKGRGKGNKEKQQKDLGALSWYKADK